MPFKKSVGEGRASTIRQALVAALTPVRLLALASLVGLLALRIWDPAPVEILRLQAFDQYQRWLPRQQGPATVIVVDIDEASLEELGQWPWPRSLVARLVQRIMDAGAVAVAFDIVFAEPDRLSPGEFAKTTDQLTPQMAEKLNKMQGNDQQFADVIRGARVVLGRAAKLGNQQDSWRGAINVTTKVAIGADPLPYLWSWPTILPNLRILEDAAAGLGMLTLAPQRDSVVRRVPVVLRVGNDVHPALSLELLRVAAGQRSFGIKTNEAGVESVFVAGAWIPTDSHGRIWVRYAKHDSVNFVSARDLLSHELPHERLAGKLVLVGSSAAGLFDIRSTPLDGAVPSVAVHAQVIESILGGTHLFRPNYTLFVELAVIAASALLLIVLVPIRPAYWTMAFFLSITTALASASWYYFSQKGVLLDAAYPTVATLSVYALLSFANYAREEAGRRQIRAAFDHYLSPELVDQLAKDPSKLTLGGENREMTLLFSDVQDFASLSEKYDAQSLTKLINRLLTPLTDTILEAHGTIDKYIGDCIMAFWNAPMPNEEHARDACLAALAMFDSLEKLNVNLEKEAEEAGVGFKPLKVGIGLNTGVCCVGNMGSEHRFDYSVIGDAVNIASRLEGQTRIYHVPIIVGEGTQARASDLATLELDLVKVKGKGVPARIFALLGNDETARSDEFVGLARSQTAMLAAYRAQDWEAAKAELQRCRAYADQFGIGALLDTYATRIAAYEVDGPGQNWDGVSISTTK